MSYVSVSNLQIARPLYDFVTQELLTGLNVKEADVWSLLDTLVNGFGVNNQALLDRRAELQEKIDQWHLERRGLPHDAEAYKCFLFDIGYLEPRPEPFKITTETVDEEIAKVAGPQLVVPITNARYALNAANARWGSLYDALYGTDAIPEEGEAQRGASYNPVRGAKVVAWVKAFLDKSVPLADGRWDQITRLRIENAQLVTNKGGLKHPKQFSGYLGSAESPFAVMMHNNGLAIGLRINADHFLGMNDPMHLADVAIEAALSCIMDCEDSVATVDAAEKVVAYRNWLGLMRGDLSESFTKNGEQKTRKLNPDHRYLAPDGNEAGLQGRTLMLVRNVGHLMRNPAVLDSKGEEAFEGLIDAVITTLGAMHDLKKTQGARNSRKGSVYIVKPKMHGPQEVAFTCKIFDTIEKELNLPRNTLKLGIMDEERRTTLNLAACIYEARERVVFINTGFLDRTGDEIHTSMEAGPVVRKEDMKQETWIKAYENWSVDTGLACGLKGRAQIGKGMWAMPDKMAEMLEQKIAHPQAGANCSWVPSPTAATLHATHYHDVSVALVQAELAGQTRASLDALLQIPLHHEQIWSDEEILKELRSNAQSILGYVVRWIDAGVGCSKVPDINNIGLMEDRATLRISSQLLANWLHHGLISKTQVIEVMREMAQVVDTQNAQDKDYKPMAPAFDGIAFKTACDLVIKGRGQPNGYTEPLLHANRIMLKEAL